MTVLNRVKSYAEARLVVRRLTQELDRSRYLIDLLAFDQETIDGTTNSLDRIWVSSKLSEEVTLYLVSMHSTLLETLSYMSTIGNHNKVLRNALTGC